MKNKYPMLSAPIVLFTLLLTNVQFAFGKPNLASKQEYQKMLEKMASLSESEIDIGKVSLELAADISPMLNVEGYSKKIDKMVADVKTLN